MANNGNHATLPILEPPYAPDAPPAKTMTSDLSIEIGDAVATGAILLCQVIRDHRETGVFDPEIKDAIAGRIAKVVELQLDYEFGDDQFCKQPAMSVIARCVVTLPTTMTRSRPLRRSTSALMACLRS